MSCERDNEMPAMKTQHNQQCVHTKFDEINNLHGKTHLQKYI